MGGWISGFLSSFLVNFSYGSELVVGGRVVLSWQITLITLSVFVLGYSQQQHSLFPHCMIEIVFYNSGREEGIADRKIVVKNEQASSASYPWVPYFKLQKHYGCVAYMSEGGK